MGQLRPVDAVQRAGDPGVIADPDHGPAKRGFPRHGDDEMAQPLAQRRRAVGPQKVSGAEMVRAQVFADIPAEILDAFGPCATRQEPHREVEIDEGVRGHFNVGGQPRLRQPSVDRRSDLPQHVDVAADMGRSDFWYRGGVHLVTSRRWRATGAGTSAPHAVADCRKAPGLFPDQRPFGKQYIRWAPAEGFSWRKSREIRQAFPDAASIIRNQRGILA